MSQNAALLNKKSSYIPIFKLLNESLNTAYTTNTQLYTSFKAQYQLRNSLFYNTKFIIMDLFCKKSGEKNEN